MANQSKIARYNKYLDRTVIIAVIAVIALGAVLAFFWLYYVPRTEKKALKVNFIDQRDPSSMVAPSTTEQNISLKSVASNNMQAPSSSSNLVGNNDPLGNYQKAQLRQFCSIGDTSNAINLPEFFEYQQCDEGLKCTSGILKEGAICLADIGAFCSSYSDCVPGADACVNNICTVINYDTKLNTPCENDLDCQLNSFEDQINNHICVNNICKINLFPYDGGCQFDSDCPPLTPSDYHQVRCVKSNNFSDTLIGASIISVNSDGLSVRLDVDFSFKNIIDSAENFMLNVIDKNTDINDIQNFYPYTISGVSDGDKTMELTQLEFYQGTYPSFTLSTGISVTFGDRALQEAFVGTNTKTGGPYGICLDLLPLGGPADLKIANVTIPGVSNSKVLDNKIVSSSRLQTGRLGQFCLTTAENNSSLGCGKYKLLDKIWQMECGYNYNYNELQVDNLFYNLFQDQWDIDLIGSCMIKNTTKLQTCNNQTNGCLDPNICLPILDPLSNTFNYYCVPQFRSQLCDTTNQCPEGYTCQGKNCLSNSNNLAVLKTDCINGNLANNYDIFVYNPERSQYYPLNLYVQDVFGRNSNLTNINFKMSDEYQTVTSYEGLGINSKTRLPKSLLVYGTSTFAGTNDKKINGAVYSIQDNKYQLDKNFSIQVNKDNPIHDINLVQGKLAVVQKKTISGFRETAYKVGSIQNLVGYFQINLENINNDLENINNDLWFNFNILRHDVKYDFFLYSSDGKYNYKGNGTAKIATGDNGILVDSILTNVSLPTYDSSSSQDIYIIFNTNQYAFNNNRYYNALNTGSYSNFSNLTGIDAYVFDTGIAPGEKMWLPSNWNTALTPSGMGDSYYGESSFLIPLVYRNKGTGIAPDYTSNYTPIENGDRIKLNSEMNILSMKNFNTNKFIPLDDSDIGTKNLMLEIANNSYLYTEKSTRYKYFNNRGTEVRLNNIILNLHPDFLSSEGNVPIFESGGIEYAFHNQNLLYKNPSETDKGVPFTVYDDMVNYTVNFLTLNSDGLYELSESETFIGVSTDSNSYGKIYLDNGINNSMTYCFEKDTDVDFKFYNNNDKNYMMITSTVEGVSSYHNYVQKIEYQIESGSTNNGLEQFQNFDVSGENYYDKFFYNTYTNRTGGYYNSIRFKYLDQFMAPKPKSLYFDNSVAQNTISSIEENLFNSDPNAISIFSNFYNNDLIEEQGTDNIDLISNNYSNKAPPIASYSTLNKVSVSNQDDQINIQYDGVNFSSTQEFNYVEIDNGISLDYTASNNCVNTANNDGENYITLRDSEIIEIFLSNPSSEIVLQKNGDSLEEFYINGVSGVKEGATYASKQFISKTSKIPQENFTSYGIEYESNFIEDNLQNNNLEINRSVVSIKEYNIFLDENAKIQEFMVIKLNAPLDISDTYIKNCFNSSNKWKIWHNNVVPITYYNSLDFGIRSNNEPNDTLYISSPSSNYEEQLINIMDGSVLWSGCQNSEKVLGSKLSKTSYNKLMFYKDNKFSIYNAHDGYYYAQELEGNDNSLRSIIEKGGEEDEFEYTGWNMLTKYNDDIEFFENALPVNFLSPITVNITPTINYYGCANAGFNYYQNLYLDSNYNIDTYSNFKFFLSNAFYVRENRPFGVINTRYPELLSGTKGSELSKGSLIKFPYESINQGQTYLLKSDEWDNTNDSDFFSFFNSQCIPKKVKFWNINAQSLLMYYLYPGVQNTVIGDIDTGAPNRIWQKRMTAHAPAIQNSDYFNIIPYSNNDFLYFKKKYIKSTSIGDNNYNILSLSGNNKNDNFTICKKLDDQLNNNDNGNTTTQFRLIGGGNAELGQAYYYWTKGVPLNNLVNSVSLNDNSGLQYSNDIVPVNETWSFQYGFDTIYQNNIKGINTRTEPNSFKLNNINYGNSFTVLNIIEPWPSQTCGSKPVPPNNTNPNYLGFAMYYTQDGYYEIRLKYYKPPSVQPKTFFEGFLEMRPQYSSSICTPDQFSNYNQTLYMINNLFLSSLPKQIDTFQYLNLNILDDYIISNLFYTNVNNNGVVKTKRKGFGLINFKINRAPIFSNTQKDANSFNLVNYDEVRFPSWFTERYISRLNAIPRIKSVFTSIREGNIFDSMRYYVYLQYSTVDSDDPNDQILFMTTDVDQNTVLENEGIPYTLSLTQGDIPTGQLERLTKFEPFNKFLFTVSGYCA